MPAIDLCFPLRASTVPRDHGYALYAAISRSVPALHEAPWLGIHPLSGQPIDEHHLRPGRHAELRLRLPAERIAEALPLAGGVLDVAGHPIQLGPPSVHALVSAPALDARLVLVKLTDTPRTTSKALDRETLDTAAMAERYRAELERQLRVLDIRRPFELHGRRSLQIGDRRLLGFSVRVLGLDAEESLRLQEHGLGGKRRMGCGVFRPTRGA